MRQLRLSEKAEFAVGTRVTARVYADCRPGALQTANLQKGVVLLSNGKELVEEGLGIGAPVCLYRDGARFSLSAVTSVDDSDGAPSVIKTYNMDAVEAKRFRGASIRSGSFAKPFLRILEKAYRGFRSLHSSATMMLSAVSMIGLANEYVPCQSKGKIAVTYQPSKEGLYVDVNFQSIEMNGLQGLIIVNEQGGRSFTDYVDSSGVRMRGDEIEPWRPTSTEWASLLSPAAGVGFEVHRPRGWRIVRGREVVASRMSWSGLDLICSALPTSRTVRYSVKVLGDASVD